MFQMNVGCHTLWMDEGWRTKDGEAASALVLRLLRSTHRWGCRHELDLFAAGRDAGGTLGRGVELIRVYQRIARLAVAFQDEQRFTFVHPEDRLDLRARRRDLERAIEACERGFGAAKLSQQGALIVPDTRVIWLDLQRAVVACQRVVEAAHVGQRHRAPEPCGVVAFIDLQRPLEQLKRCPGLVLAQQHLALLAQQLAFALRSWNVGGGAGVAFLKPAELLAQ